MEDNDRDCAPPEPRRAGNAAEFVAEMRRLKAWSGLTFRQLERDAVAAGDVLPHSTLVAALRRDRLPREELLRAFVRACGCDPEQVAAWTAARRRLAADIAVASAPGAGTRAGDSATREQVSAGDAGEIPALAGTSRPDPRVRRRPPMSAAAALAALAALLIAPGSAVHDSTVPGDPTPRAATSGDCPRRLARGAYGTCVVRLQEQLRRLGFVLPADAWYGPYTKMRVAAFQTLANLPNTGMADQETWRALESGARMVIPSIAETERRIGEWFGDTAAEAISLARCLSNTDPLWIYSTEAGIRRWGLFQFTDLELHRAGGTQAMALDPEWSIRAAHAVWKRTGDFRHWKCDPSAIPRVAVSPTQR